MIQTETTPNPDSLKFLSENIISEVGTEEFQKIDISKIKNTFIKEILNIKKKFLVILFICIRSILTLSIYISRFI